MRTIVVTDYQPTWATVFDELRQSVEAVVGEFAVAVEHVGSTSVPGLAAKPIIDMGVVVRGREDVPRAIERLATIGYAHRGDLGIDGREAFFAPDERPEHHLYVYEQGCLALRNHLELRDHLRRSPEAVQEYGALKKRLALDHPTDNDRYGAGKTDFILSVLERYGIDEEELRSIDRMNRSD